MIKAARPGLSGADRWIGGPVDLWIGTKAAQLYFRPAIWRISKTPVIEVGESERCIVDRFDAYK